MNDRILTIDVGVSSLKVAEFSFPDEGKMFLEGYRIEDLEPFSNIPLSEQIEHGLRNAFANHPFKSRTVYLSISSQHTFVRFARIPVLGNEEKQKQLVQYEAKQIIPSQNDVTWDFQMLASADDQNNHDFMVTAVKNELIADIIGAIEQNRCHVVHVELAACSCYNLARAINLGQSQCSMILYMGSKSSNLIFIEGNHFFLRNIPIGGDTISRQISSEFSIPYPEAEELKRRHGFVAPGGAYEEPDSEVAASISKISRNIMTRLHGEIVRSISRYRAQHGSKPHNLLLAGGSSIMALTPRFFMEKLRIPVDYLNPFHIVTVNSELDKEALAENAHLMPELIGAALHHIMVCPVDMNLLPKDYKQQQVFNSKKPFLYAAAAVLVISLLAGYFILSFEEKQFRQKLVAYDRQVTDILTNKHMIVQKENQLSKIQNRYAFSQNLLQDRDTPINLLNELQKLIPPQMWMVSIKKVFMSSGTQKATNILDEIFPNRQVRKTGQEEWLELEGHAYHQDKVISYIEIFRNNIQKSPLFTNNEEDIKLLYVKPESGNNNISSFKLIVKL